MAITISTGVTAQISDGTFGTQKTISAITNANPAVATVDSATGIVANDYIEIRSGWGLLDQRVVRVSVVSGNNLTLEGVDTSSTSKYPAGQGIGTCKEIGGWVSFTQVKGISSSGGDLQFADTTALDDVVGKQVPTIRSPMAMTLDVFDDPSLSWYTGVVEAADSRSPYALLMSFPNGSKMVANAYWSINKVPTIATNEALVTQVSLSFAAEPLRYAS
jgi:hypothetical protein